MLVGPRKTLFMDEISSGLDSSTTFQIVKAMGDFTHLAQATILMSLLQPAPEVRLSVPHYACILLELVQSQVRQLISCIAAFWCSGFWHRTRSKACRVSHCCK